MELGHIHEFCVLAETENYLEAACDLDISQSTLSRHIQGLEEELGTPLFTRSTRRVRLSAYGEILLPYARQMLEIERNIRGDFALERRAAKKALSLGMIPAMSQYNITGILASFQKRDAGVSFEITEAESAELKDKLRGKTLDFAFVREVDESEREFISIPFALARLAAVLPASHPLAAETSVRVKDLRSENFLLLPEGTLMHKLCIDACKAAGFEPRICYTGHRANNIIELVAKGMGIALLTGPPALALSTGNIAVVNLDPVIETRIDFIYLAKRMLSLEGRAFLRYIKEQVLCSASSAASRSRSAEPGPKAEFIAS